MSARVYLLIADTPSELEPTFKLAPGKPVPFVQQTMALEDFRRLDAAELAELVDGIDQSLARIRRGDVR